MAHPDTPTAVARLALHDACCDAAEHCAARDLHADSAFVEAARAVLKAGDVPAVARILHDRECTKALFGQCNEAHAQTLAYVQTADRVFGIVAAAKQRKRAPR